MSKLKFYCEKLFSYDKNYIPVSFLFIFIIAIFWVLLLLTNGFDAISGPERTGKVFDDMFLRLLEFRFDISHNIIDDEAFVKDGKSYAYFSIFPALLRAFFYPFVDLNKFSISRISCFFAISTIMLFWLKTALSFICWNNFNKYQKAFTFIIALFCLFNGAQFYMTAISPVYHEVILWAAAFSSVYIYFLASRVFNKKEFDTRTLSLMALMAGLTLHNRVSVAIGLYGCLCFILLLYFYDEVKSKLKGEEKTKIQKIVLNTIFQKKYLYPLFIMFLFGCGCLFINYMRWGNPFLFAYYDGYSYIMSDNHRYLSIKRDGLFNFARIPTALAYYLTGSKNLVFYISSKINVLFDGMEVPWRSGLLMSPVLSALSLIGIFSWVKKLFDVKNIDSKELMLVLAVPCFFMTVFLMLSFMYLSLRYRVDFMSFCWFTALIGIFEIQKEISEDKKIKNTIIIMVFALLFVFGFFYGLQTVTYYKTIGLSVDLKAWAFVYKYLNWAY